MGRAVFLLSLILLPGIVAAQSSSQIADVEMLPVPSWAQTVIDAFSQPVHPVIGGVASGGGIGVGVGYDSADAAPWYREAEAMVTMRRYWSFAGEMGRRTASRRSQFGVFGTVRHMNRIDYFGIGPRTAFGDRAAFRLRETTFGARGWVRPRQAIRLGGSAALYLPALGPGASPSVRSIEEVYSESAVPGFSAEPRFGRYRGLAEIMYPGNTRAHRYQGAYQFALEAVRDHDTGQYNFHRWEAEVRHRIPGVRPGQQLTLHGLLASTGGDADVPFYLLYTLGGSGGLKAFRPDLLGSDGTRATLRSFHNYRFRDRDLLLMQAEYRFPVGSRVHATVFFDAGQVAPRTSALFEHPRTGTGFSLSYMRNGRPLARMDVGYGGGEGVQVFWSFGAFQN